jgi:hypothetical protein
MILRHRIAAFFGALQLATLGLGAEVEWLCNPDINSKKLFKETDFVFVGKVAGYSEGSRTLVFQPQKIL